MAEQGKGYAVSSLDELGDGYGFRKIRQGLGVTAFGINAVVLPSHYESGPLAAGSSKGPPGAGPANAASGPPGTGDARAASGPPGAA
jgi:hypothetical protein